MAKIKTIAAGQTHSDGLCIGDATTSKLAFNGTAPIVQPVGAAQAAVDATALTGAAGANPTQAEYATVITKVNALVTLANGLRLPLVNLGLIKGAA